MADASFAVRSTSLDEPTGDDQNDKRLIFPDEWQLSSDLRLIHFLTLELSIFR